MRRDLRTETFECLQVGGFDFKQVEMSCQPVENESGQFMAVASQHTKCGSRVSDEGINGEVGSHGLENNSILEESFLGTIRFLSPFSLYALAYTL